MNNSDYWKRRIGMLEEARNADNTKLAERLQNEIDYALKELDDRISGWYRRLADNNCVSMAQARKLLSAKELKEFYWTVDEYIEKGRENGIRHNWEKELENASARVHINKFEALKIELRGIAERLGISEENQLKEHLSAQYEDTYYHTAFELQDGFGVYQNTAKVNQKHLNTVLSKPWTADNKTFSDRIWEDKDALISEVTRQLTRNILLGRPRDDSIRAITKRFETSKSNAARLVHTESAYISAEAARDTYDYLDVDRFEVDAALDSKTCSICGEMDGKVFETKDYQPGLTANPFHPNCRCTTVPYIDDDIQRELEEKTGRSMRNPETGKTEIVSRMTYKEWKAKYVDNSDKSGIIKADKVISGHLGTPKSYKANSVIDHKTNEKTDVRTFYDAKGLKSKDINTTPHGNPKHHSYGVNGEHVHDYEWDGDKLKSRTTRELTQQERKENSDIL